QGDGLVETNPAAGRHIDRGAAAVGVVAVRLLVLAQPDQIELGEHAVLRKVLDRLGEPIGRGDAGIEAIAYLELVVLEARGVKRARVHGQVGREEAGVRESKRKAEGARARLARGLEPLAVV